MLCCRLCSTLGRVGVGRSCRQEELHCRQVQRQEELRLADGGGCNCGTCSYQAFPAICGSGRRRRNGVGRDTDEEGGGVFSDQDTLSAYVRVCVLQCWESVVRGKRRRRRLSRHAACLSRRRQMRVCVEGWEGLCQHLCRERRLVERRRVREAGKERGRLQRTSLRAWRSVAVREGGRRSWMLASIVKVRVCERASGA
jgi:hypothetical protein